MPATQRSFQAAAALAFAKCAYYSTQALFLQEFYLEGQDQWHGWLSHPVKALMFENNVLVQSHFLLLYFIFKLIFISGTWTWASFVSAWKMRCSSLLFMTCMQSSITMEEWLGATTQPTLGCQAIRIVSAVMLVSLHSPLCFHFMIWSEISICSPCPSFFWFPW